MPSSSGVLHNIMTHKLTRNMCQRVSFLSFDSHFKPTWQKIRRGRTQIPRSARMNHTSYLATVRRGEADFLTVCSLPSLSHRKPPSSLLGVFWVKVGRKTPDRTLRAGRLCTFMTHGRAPRTKAKQTTMNQLILTTNEIITVITLFISSEHIHKYPSWALGAQENNCNRTKRLFYFIDSSKVFIFRNGLAVYQFDSHLLGLPINIWMLNVPNNL